VTIRNQGAIRTVRNSFVKAISPNAGARLSPADVNVERY
jgi:hypothetical protein